MNELQQLFDELHSIPALGTSYDSFRAIKLMQQIGHVAEQEYGQDYELLEYGNPQSYVVVLRGGTDHMADRSHAPHYAWFNFAQRMVNAQQEGQGNG